MGYCTPKQSHNAFIHSLHYTWDVDYGMCSFTLQPELSFPHTPVGIAWNANSLIACMKKDQLFYYRVTVSFNLCVTYYMYLL